MACASAVLTPSTAARSVTLARATALAEPKLCSKAFLRLGPMPAISSSGLTPMALLRRARCDADGEAMRLVAQALNVVEDRIAGLEHEGRLAHDVEMLAAGIAVRPLGHAGKRQIGKPQLVEDGLGRRELALAAINEDQIRPLRSLARRHFGLPVTLFLQQPGKAAGQHFPHHGESRPLLHLRCGC